MIKNYLLNNHPLPLVIGPENETENSFPSIYGWLQKNKSWALEKIEKHGAILLRDFEIKSIDEFASICNIFQPNLKDYRGGNSPRTLLKQNIYTSTEYPKDKEITQHQELSYTLSPPRHLFFYCELPADSGGETPLTDCRVFLENLSGNTKKKFKNKKIKYIQNLPEEYGFGKTWKDVFKANDRAEVEQILKDTEAKYYWKEDGTLHWEQIVAGVGIHPQTQEAIWLNQADQWHISQFDEVIQEGIASIFENPSDFPLYSMWEDDTEFDVKDFHEIKKLFDQLCVKNPWKKRDVLILDNLLVSHGRMPFEGDRKIFVAMG